MKKKLLLVVSMIAVLTCLLAGVIGASIITTTDETNIVSVTDSDEFGAVSYIKGISVTDRFDTSARVVLRHTVGETYHYTTYPTYYILYDNHEQKFDFAAINEALASNGISYDASSIIRIEFPNSIDDKNTKIGGGILSGSNVRYAKIPSTTSGINWSAFSNSKLEEVKFELDVIDGVEKVRFTSLGDAFYNNVYLKYFEFPNGLVNIKNCLSGCKAVEWATIPETVETIGKCFSGCNSLKWVNFSEKTKVDFDSGVYAMFASCESLERIYIPSTVTGLSTGSQRHFEMCAGLTEICFGVDAEGNSSFTGFLGQLTFRGCNKLTTIVMPAIENLTIVDNAFGEYDANPTIYIVGDLATAQKTINALKATAKFAEYETVSYVEGKSDYGACFVTGATYCQLGWHGNNTYTNDCIETCDICEAEVIRLDAKHTNRESIVFGESGYLGTTVKVNACVNCMTKAGEGKELAPLFYNYGYSCSEISMAVMQSFVIDRDMLPIYEEIVGKLSYGIIAAVETNQEGTSFAGQLYDAETGAFKNKVAYIDMTEKTYDLIEMRIINLEGYEDVDLYCCGYVNIGGKVYYLNNNKMLKKAVASSFNDLM